MFAEAPCTRFSPIPHGSNSVFSSSPPMLRTAVFYTSVVAVVFVLFNAFSPTSFYNKRLSNMSTSLSGWHSRATPYPDSFTPERSALRLVVLQNAPADPEGFTLALFDSPSKIAVDAAGRVLSIQDSDFEGLVALADQTKDLPSTGTFRNTWVIQQPMTSRPIERVLLPVDGVEYKETSVQGYDGVKTELKRPVGDYRSLPSILKDLIGLVVEARGGADGDRDESTINRVKAILGDVF